MSHRVADCRPVLAACLAVASLVVAGCQGGAGEKPTSKAEMDQKLAMGEVKTPGTPTPQMQAVLDELAALRPKPIETLNAGEARKQPDATMAVNNLLKKRGQPVPPNDGVTVENKTIAGEVSDLPVRIFTPPGGVANRPVILFLRGGGWVIATLDTYEPSCRALAVMTGAKVIELDYRQAPEHKYPAAHEDAYAALQSVFATAASMGCDPNRVAVVGESAGGNMAAAVCLMARDRGGRMPVASVMIYPVAATIGDTPSKLAYKNAKPLNTAMLPWFVNQYAPTAEDKNSPYLNILRDTGDLSKFPPATVITADIDPLHSEGEAWAAKLRAGHVDLVYQNYKGVTHEFFGMGAVVDEAKLAEKLASDRLKAAFAAVGKRM